MFLHLLLLRSRALSLGFTILVEIFAYVTIFYSNQWGSHIPSLWMVCAGCVFVAGIHPSRIWMSGSFESVQWSVCVHRLVLGLYSHPKELLGNGVRTHVNSKGKILSTRKIIFTGGSNLRHCIKQDSEPNTLPTELFWPPNHDIWFDLFQHHLKVHHDHIKTERKWTQHGLLMWTLWLLCRAKAPESGNLVAWDQCYQQTANVKEFSRRAFT